jgi:formylglycine-generating enzyme required for sulfatase activity
MSQIVVSEEESLRPVPAKEVLAGFGEMVAILAGEFLYGEDKQTAHIDADFQIDIYPVTNFQFQEFITSKGYVKNEYWSEEGIKWRIKNGILKPKYWNDERWNQPKQPVVGVSWYEADAYARWCGKTLPSEEQWERAARGTDGRNYPWGDDFDKEKCNSRESGIGKTTRVTRYPNGISPEGCYDMVGNVREWTVNKWDKGTIVLRGGSWLDDLDDARCVSRGEFHPIDRSRRVGFRCVRI